MADLLPPGDAPVITVPAGQGRYGRVTRTIWALTSGELSCAACSQTLFAGGRLARIPGVTGRPGSPLIGECCWPPSFEVPSD
jgi:hypothetical protein